MKRILYTILLAIGTLSFSSCTDYINVDKYFYDQVSLDSAFSKRVYVEGWWIILVNIESHFAGLVMTFTIRI